MEKIVSYLTFIVMLPALALRYLWCVVTEHWAKKHPYFARMVDVRHARYHVRNCRRGNLSPSLDILEGYLSYTEVSHKEAGTTVDELGQFRHQVDTIDLGYVLDLYRKGNIDDDEVSDFLRGRCYTLAEFQKDVEIFPEEEELFHKVADDMRQ